MEKIKIKNHNNNKKKNRIIGMGQNVMQYKQIFLYSKNFQTSLSSVKRIGLHFSKKNNSFTLTSHVNFTEILFSFRELQYHHLVS